MKNKIMWILIFLMVIGSCYMCYSTWKMQQQLKATNDELVQTKKELDHANFELANAKIDNSELDCCPFCGSKNVIFCVGNFIDKVSVNCKSCGANTSYNYNSKEEAKKAWNNLPRDSYSIEDEDLPSSEGN